MNKQANIQCTIEDGDEKSSEYVKQQMLEYNSKFIQPVGPSKNVPVHLVLKAEDGTIMGGLSATIFYLRARCYIDRLWIHESLRGLDYGTKLMNAIEEKVKLENCNIILVDTFSFQAPRFYEKLGYQVYGKLDDYPSVGLSSFYYQKRLDKPSTFPSPA